MKQTIRLKKRKKSNPTYQSIRKAILADKQQPAELPYPSSTSGTARP